MIQKDCCDFAAYGKPFLADADFVEHSAKSNDYKSCFECRECKWFTNSEKCPAQIIAKDHVN